MKVISSFLIALLAFLSIAQASPKLSDLISHLHGYGIGTANRQRTKAYCDIFVRGPLQEYQGADVIFYDLEASSEGQTRLCFGGSSPSCRTPWTYDVAHSTLRWGRSHEFIFDPNTLTLLRYRVIATDGIENDHCEITNSD